MNSITWKGVSSTTINGLLISELPPITIPAMRVKETIIDGRDGSILEDLGYSSYDKSVQIGLYGNYDINKVIKYFTGEGEIVFSNEPDKVYTAKIIQQIDYNRLLRFRQATVIFRTQPFKRKLFEAYKETQTAVASGKMIAVNDSAEASFKKLSIYGKTTQDGTPTPTTPVELVSVADGGGIGVRVTGKNLIDPDVIKLSTRFDNFVCCQDEGLLLGAGTYTMSIGEVCDALYVHAHSDGSNLAQVNRSKSLTFTITEPKLIWLQFYKGSTFQSSLADTIQLEVGNVATAYEPYNGSSVVIAARGLSGIPVTSGGNYTDASGQQWVCDEIDLSRGVYIHRINVVDFFDAVGTRDVYPAGGDVYRFSFWFQSNPTYLPGTNQGGMCNALTYSPLVVNNNMVDNAVCAYPNGGIFVRCDACKTVEEFVTWAKSIDLKVQYALAEPIETHLTKEELDDIAHMHAYHGGTTVINDVSANMGMEYFKTYEVFNEGSETSKPIMVLKGYGKVTVSVNGNETFSYTFPENETEVIIDSEKEDAYLGTVLKNRNMLGEFPVLAPGTNIFDWSGEVYGIEILPRSRWL